MDQHPVIIAGLITVMVAGGMYALVYPYLSGDIKAQKRAASLITSADRGGGSRVSDPAKRRKMISENLKDIEAQNKKPKKRVSVEQRIAQAGLNVSRRSFFIGSALFALMMTLVLLMINNNPLVVVGGGAASLLGAPDWVLRFLRKRRMAKFIDEFPGAVDIIVRGVKAGLPVGDCFRTIANETPEPVRGEFRKIIESTAMGLTIGEATERFAERVPVSEASFFAIVISIQQKSGGNLAEALGNLSAVLRDRKKMQGKIKAMSSEAKASAGIIGSLPFLVGGAVWLTTPSYMMILFTTGVGKAIVAGSLVWMAIGVAIMKKMISFDF
ncbi:MAG: type II secretion system F family protein [Methylocystis sp.]|nr:type II secretion system F family protein [Methylocystis sp.]